MKLNFEAFYGMKMDSCCVENVWGLEMNKMHRDQSWSNRKYDPEESFTGLIFLIWNALNDWDLYCNISLINREKSWKVFSMYNDQSLMDLK